MFFKGFHIERFLFCQRSALYFVFIGRFVDLALWGSRLGTPACLPKTFSQGFNGLRARGLICALVSDTRAPRRKRMQARNLILLCCLCWMQPLCANDQTASASYPKFEAGVAAGFPGNGLLVGYWGGEQFPIVARIALGLGSQLDLGLELPISSRPSKRLFIGGSAGVIGYFGVMKETLYSLGPIVSLHLDAFFIQAGPSFYFGKSDQFAAQGMIGYSLFF